MRGQEAISETGEVGEGAQQRLEFWSWLLEQEDIETGEFKLCVVKTGVSVLEGRGVETRVGEGPEWEAVQLAQVIGMEA